MSSTLGVRVRLSDSNARGCVDDTRLLVFFEEARADAMRNVGLPYDEIVARGLHALTVEARLRNHAPAHPDELLTVRVWVADIGRLRFTFMYDISREGDHTLVASGETVHICVQTGREQPARVPDWLREGLSHLRPPEEVTRLPGGA